MPYRQHAAEARIVHPDDLALLGRAFERSSAQDESDVEREARASRIISYFLAGVRGEDELVTLASQPLGR
ncbi:hypothetical protein L598_001200000050 [Mesorhizobium sp. J18]|uniref:hypothetical protein n=1 Tax=Mesorhizobium sp. J18 TaxID=935263 RepID=UPI00119AB575|nr:hypothetical protein [Mesorhizobium sp. J18]TWG99873.1 hypothetical protein L598_001200000050 [Mesorhizobium sp. J18]